MRKTGEIVFDAVYLAVILCCGVLLLWRGEGNLAALFGAMALVLGGGDALHLIPRMRALWTGRPYPRLLGMGKWATSITSTLYYALLFEVWAVWNSVGATPWRGVVWGLAALRIALCCHPGNRWLQGEQPLSWGLWRNLPFCLMGLVIACLFLFGAGGPLRFMPAAILLSFLFYLPVVLFAGKRPWVGMLMMPKTLVYLWIQWMGIVAALI